MKKEFLIKMKNELVKEKNILLSKPQQDYTVDYQGDDTDVIQAKILALIQSRLSSREQDRLRKIDSALAKIADGTFGTCEECGEAIAEKRLAFNPQFITC